MGHIALAVPSRGAGTMPQACPRGVRASGRSRMPTVCAPHSPAILAHEKRGVDVCEKRVFKIEPTGVARSSATMRLQKFLEVERFDPDQAAGEPDDRKLAAVRPTSDCPGRAADVVARLLEGQEPARGSRSRADGSRHSGLLIQSPGWNPSVYAGSRRVLYLSCTGSAADRSPSPGLAGSSRGRECHAWGPRVRAGEGRVVPSRF
jgi:hypothetical protein